MHRFTVSLRFYSFRSLSACKPSPSLLCHALEGGGLLTGDRGLRTGYLSSQETKFHGRAGFESYRLAFQLPGACISFAMSISLCAAYRV
ncbi:hypothetical protein JAAARDRAFT_256739 [Jaapia argillacea MUCL 33604]|uniref:Uncharacterized protein n=1 Tax=Jaapia argillacea MUCL 33604 TaxID=933084 RepID=A0A067PTF5_9AGAM|nr:hypothetical protein JAAARDRAFT_256739 [Jaapia argillacea MUCL 33604]